MKPSSSINSGRASTSTSRNRQNLQQQHTTSHHHQHSSSTSATNNSSSNNNNNNNNTSTPTPTHHKHQQRRSINNSTPVAGPNVRNPVFGQQTPVTSSLQQSSATRFGGLSAKQVDKISSAIASVRDPGRGPSILKSSDLTKHHSTLKINQVGFHDAPLNSRLPALTPRKVSMKSITKPLRSSNNRIGSLDDEDDDDEEEEEEEDYENEKTQEFLKNLMRPNFQTFREQQQVQVESLGGIDRLFQEALMIEDLLFVLMGIEGNFIEFDSSYSPDDPFERLQGARFIIADDHLDPSLKELVERIIPLATYYTSIDAFVAAHSHLDYGLVNHALCACIRDYLKDYMILVVQLEDQFSRSPDFTLQRFWFYVQDMLHTLKLLNSLTSELVCLYSPDLISSDDDSDGGLSEGGSEHEPGLRAVLREYDSDRRNQKGGRAGTGEGGLVKGGEVLAVLEERVMKTLGDPIASDLYSDLLLKASQPYCKMLVEWVTKGILDDPYEEFMVKESKSITRGTLEVDFTDEYWERKYILRNRSTGGAASTSTTAPDHQLGSKPPGSRATLSRERGVWGGAVVPRFLEVWEVKILLAGKYVNVMRECGVQKPDNEALDLLDETLKDSKTGMIKMNDDRFYSLVDRAYVSANRSLLELLMKSEDLLGRLRSLKHHFFLSQGDSFTTFLDSASYELGKKLRHVNVSRLQNQFDLAIRNPSSSSSSDPYKEDVKVTMANTNLIEWLLRIVGVTGAIGGSQVAGGGGGGGEGAGNLEGGETMDNVGAGLAELAAAGSSAISSENNSNADARKEGLNGIDALQLDYTVRFPLSLVISRKTVLRYQLIFRYLLQLKHLEHSLTNSWTEHAKSGAWKKVKPTSSTATTTTKEVSLSMLEKNRLRLELWKRRIFNLRGKMLSFIQSLYNFVCFEVLEKNYQKLERRLAEQVDTVDGLLKEHVDFLDTCLKECMLTNSKLLKIYQKLTTACSMFSSYTSHFTKSANSFNLAFTKLSSEMETDRGEDHQRTRKIVPSSMPNRPINAPISTKLNLNSSGGTSKNLIGGGGNETEILNKFLLAENALKKFEQNFHHHSQVHIDMVTYFASSENLALLALAVRLTNVR
ncbi:Spc98 family-domain-containing protein [Phakopsora pachyrhizi]|uniref:Spc98 family-domain-containing protein n=1 Tax=Phakopsora pachyrhizi TaxID=170000 RepID=A0AAV0BNE6_PHAPC|nr:Spc98 family-domain-containing protein [Phakopsora pachyrhizi]